MNAIIRGTDVFTASRMLFGTVCSFGVTFSVAASGADLPLTQSKPAITASQSVPSVRSSDTGPHVKRLSAQRSKADAKTKRADLLEPRYWGGGASSKNGVAHVPIPVPSGVQPRGRTPEVVFTQTPIRVPEARAGQMGARTLGEAGGHAGGGEPPIPLSSMSPAPTSGLSSPAGSSLPFVFAGRLIDRKEVTLFLIGNNRPILAKVNDVIDGTYRVDRINDGNAVLTYLPTNTQQTVVFNSTAIGASALSSPVERLSDGKPIDGAVPPPNTIGASFVNLADQPKNR